MVNQIELAEKLKQLYQELFDLVEEAKSDEYIKFCIQWGAQYPKEKNAGIMFYGRANNENNGVYYYVSEHPQGKDESTHVEALVDLISARTSSVAEHISYE